MTEFPQVRASTLEALDFGCSESMGAAVVQTLKDDQVTYTEQDE